MKTLPEIMLDPDYINCVEESIAQVLEGYNVAVELAANDYHNVHATRAKILNSAVSNVTRVAQLLAALRAEHDKIHS